MDERDRDLLTAIAGSARLALDYARGEGEGWLGDRKTVDAVAKRAEEVGELAKWVSPETLETIPAVDWRAAKAFREILVHHYGYLDLDVLADAIERKLPPLLTAVEARLAAES